MGHPLPKQRGILLLLLVVSLARMASPAHAQSTILLDADYHGTAGFVGGPPPIAFYIAEGENLFAPSGLTRVRIFVETNSLGVPEHFYQTDWSGLSLGESDTDYLEGSITGASGSPWDFSGDFTAIGRGRYQGYAGQGTFHVVADQGPPSYTPVTIHVSGRLTSAIPEPGTFLLLVAASVPLALKSRAGRGRRGG